MSVPIVATVFCFMLIGIFHEFQKCVALVETNHHLEERSLMKDVLLTVPPVKLQDVSVPYLWGTSTVELSDITLEGFWSAKVYEVPLVYSDDSVRAVFLFDQLAIKAKKYKIGVLSGTMDMVKYIGNSMRAEVKLMKSPQCIIVPVRSGVIMTDLDDPDINMNTACALCVFQSISQDVAAALNKKLYDEIYKKLPDAVALAIRKAKITNFPRLGCIMKP